MIAFQYNVFFEVATNLSFSKAADTLFISQPAVSKHIKNLESELGVPLFKRNGSSISLTRSGITLLDYLHDAKQIERSISSDIEIIRNQEHAKGELRIGASTTISLYVCPKVFSAFRKKFPAVKMLLINRNSENVLKALSNNEIDLAIIEGKQEINSFHYTLFMQDEIVPVCSVNSPYVNIKPVISELKKVPLVMRERGSGTLSTLINVLNEKGIKQSDLKIIARLGGTEALKNYILEDEGIGFLSRLAIARELENNRLREIKIEDLVIKRDFYFVMRKGEEMGGFFKSFVEIGKSYYN
ncbi:MAG: LysR substrate-binding domain-containing protein [Balneola sp.]